MSTTGILTMVFIAAHGAGTPAPDAKLATEVARVASRRILFGHMSVGQNVLEGAGRVAAASGNPLRIVDLQDPRPLQPATLSHAFVGANGDPAGKLARFEALLAATEAAPPEIAAVKFCFADFGPQSDGVALFDAYRARLQVLQRRFPRTTFVHVTAPLTTVQGGAKALLKRLLGKAPYGALENVQREAFNARMRDVYAGKEPVFDLARIEATTGAGSPVSYEWGGRAVPALDQAITDDGGHLNAEGQNRVGRALLAFMAAIP